MAGAQGDMSARVDTQDGDSMIVPFRWASPSMHPEPASRGSRLYVFSMMHAWPCSICTALIMRIKPHFNCKRPFSTSLLLPCQCDTYNRRRLESHAGVLWYYAIVIFMCIEVGLCHQLLRR